MRWVHYVVEFLLFVVYLSSQMLNNATFAFLWDKEVTVVDSQFALFPVAVRHVEYVGVKDNGTLDCYTPGFKTYKWRLFSKSAAGFYAESSELVARLKIQKHHSRVNIGGGHFELNGDMLVVTCSALLDHRPRLRIIWVITRLHSPLGYPTDPRICDFGRKSASGGCNWYRRHFNTECYYGYGNNYQGHEHFLGDGECLYWHDAWTRLYGRNMFSAIVRDPELNIIKGEVHNFCRTVSGDKRFEPWCYADGKKPTKKPCRVSECSDCIYGDGNGVFALYPNRRFPTYHGRGIYVLKKNARGERMECVEGETCKVRGKGRPSCMVKAENDEMELMECFINQCTVRLVWFLFFDTFGRSYVEQSNFDPVEMTLVDGKANQGIQFGAFGIHRASGLTVATDDGKLAKFIKDIRVITKAPNTLSQLIFKRAKKQLNGVYYIQYQFEEANPKIQQGIHRAKFRIIVKTPMRLSLKPEVLKVCHGQPGTLGLHISGEFDVLEESIHWMYGVSSKKMRRVPLDGNVFHLSKNFLSLTVKKVTKGVVIGVEGRAFSGRASTKARIEIKAQPRLRAANRTTIYGSTGEEVHLTVVSEKNLVLKWMFEAIEIPKIPDDPLLAFQRDIQDKVVLQTLVITELDFRHYGLYMVDGDKDGCKESIQLLLKPASQKPGFAEALKTAVVKKPWTEMRNLDFVKPSSRPANCRETLSVKNGEHGMRRILCPDKSQSSAQVTLSSCSKVTAVGHAILSNGTISLVQYQVDTVQWTNYTTSMQTEIIKERGINYTVNQLNYPLIAKSLRFFLEESTCLQNVTIYGCEANSEACRVERREASDVLFLGLIPIRTAVFIGGGVLAFVVGIILACRCYKKTQKGSQDSSTDSSTDSSPDSSSDSSPDSSQQPRRRRRWRPRQLPRHR